MYFVTSLLTQEEEEEEEELELAVSEIICLLTH